MPRVWHNEGVTEPQNSVAEAPEHYWHVPRLIAAWVIALLVAILSVNLAPDTARAEWLVVALGIGVLATFALQLGTAQREGFITRTSFSVGGVLVIVAAVEGVSLLIRSA